MTSFGFRPPSGYTLNLGTDNDFVQSITRSDGSDWPDGTVITLVIDTDTEWPAMLAGSVASWNVDKTDVNTLRALTNGASKSFLGTYSDATGYDVTLFSGRVAWFA